MQPLEFLAAVLPSSGVYCVAEFTTAKKEHVFVDTIDEMLDAANKFAAENKDAYFALANFRTPENRLAENAKSMKSLFMDLDLGGEKAYANRQEAIAAFDKFMGETGMAELGLPLVVSSGGGFHIYWPFDEEVPIDQWKPVAENFKRLCKQEGLNIDWNCTADAARVLRVPGTFNFKKAKPRDVKVLQQNSQTYSLFSLDSFIKAKLKAPTYEKTLSMLPGQRPKTAPNATTLKLIENSETLFAEIAKRTEEGTGCGQLAHYMSHAQEDGMEPLWRGLLSLAQKCDDGGEWAVKLSEMHPYDPDRMAQKLREIKGPYPCLKFDSENPGICTSCPHFGKITNPLMLGRKAKVETEAKEITLQTPVPNAESEFTGTTPQPITIHRPAAPKGFSFGAKGGVFRDVKVTDDEGKEVNKQVMVLPYDLFVVNILQHEEEHIVHMVAIRPTGAVEVTLNQRAVVSKDETLKSLAEQNVLAAGGWNDKNLFEYVRSAVEEASISHRVIKLPPNYGWQKDDTFVFNEHIYAPGLPPRHVPMRHLANLNEACTPNGSLDSWRKVVNMVMRHKLDGVLTFSLVAFATPLMRFTGFNGITWHIGSTDSGTGKSLSMDLISSVWGHPVHYRVGKGTSDVAMQQRLGLLNSLPMVSDEITQKNRQTSEWFPSFVFDMSEGQGKERMESGANKERRNTTRWRTHSLFTSNTHAKDLLDSREHSSQGEMLRMLEWNPTTVLSLTPEDESLIESLKINHGVAGQVYAQWMVDNVGRAEQVVREVSMRLRKEMNFTSQERFWQAGCTTLVAGAMLAAEAGIMRYPIETIIRFLQTILNEARGVRKGNLRSAEDVLNSYTADYYGKLIIVKALDGMLTASLGEDGVIDVSTARTEICGRVEHGVTAGHIDYYIEEKRIKKYCNEHSFGYSDFKKEMESKYAVSYLKKDLMSKTKGPPTRVNAIKISRRIDGDEEASPPASLEAA